jgi:hypothetical protein
MVTSGTKHLVSPLREPAGGLAEKVVLSNDLYLDVPGDTTVQVHPMPSGQQRIVVHYGATRATRRARFRVWLAKVLARLLDMD